MCGFYGRALADLYRVCADRDFVQVARPTTFSRGVQVDQVGGRVVAVEYRSSHPDILAACRAKTVSTSYGVASSRPSAHERDESERCRRRRGDDGNR